MSTAIQVQIPSVKMNSGQDVPILGLGTWKSSPGVVQKTVEDAIDLGYRHIDCALVYRNENEVGDAIQKKIAEGVVRREDLFITSKVWNNFHSKDGVKRGLQTTLESLKVDYVDLYLIHWPFGYREGEELFPTTEQGEVALSDVDFVETWKAMEEFAKAGKIKSLGLSNFNSQQIQRILDICTIKPAMLQVECHPYLNQKKLIEFCKSKGIVVTAYSPLGSPDRPWATADEPILLEDPKLLEVAKKYHKSPAQIIIRWLVQRDVVVIPKTVRKERLLENAAVFDFSLSDEDIAYIDSFNRNARFNNSERDKASKFFPFAIEF